jgi:hypothetical protein
MRRSRAIQAASLVGMSVVSAARIPAEGSTVEASADSTAAAGSMEAASAADTVTASADPRLTHEWLIPRRLTSTP